MQFQTLDAGWKIAGKVGDVAGGVLATLSRIQQLLSLAAEKPYQARLLEARINSCRALLMGLESTRIDAVHLEPLRIKLAYVEEMVKRAGAQVYLYQFTDAALAKEFEMASAALSDEGNSLALFVSASSIPVTAKGLRSRRLSPQPRRRTRSRSSSSRRSGSRSKSPLLGIREDGFLGCGPKAVVETNDEITLTDPRDMEDISEESPTCGASVSLDRVPSCCDHAAARDVGITGSEDPLIANVPSISVRALSEAQGRPRDSRCMRALLPFSTEDFAYSKSEDESGFGSKAPRPELENIDSQLDEEDCELPLPPIAEVEREPNVFWQDTVTLVFRCALTGYEHRVVTKQWSRPDGQDTAGERLVAWASKPFRCKAWEEVMDEDVEALDPAAKNALRELLQNSGWYDKFEFRPGNFGGSWITKDAFALKANRVSGYVTCMDD